MQRYSFLQGPVVAEDSELLHFLQELGAQKPQLIPEAVRNTLGGFLPQSLDAGLPQRFSPVAVRYAPMYLNKQVEGAENMKPFSAICVTGNVTLPDGRIAKFYHGSLFSRDELLAGGEHNYLDGIFSLQRTTCDDILQALDTDGKHLLARAAKVDKTYPIADGRERNAVCYAAAALYTGRSVALRVEDRGDFNERAWSLARQVYALLHPQLAAAVGFSIYDEPEQIRPIARETAIRLFLVSPEYSLEKLAEEADVVVDAASGETLGAATDPNVERSAFYWAKLPWQERQPVMKALFDGVELFGNGKPFFLLTKEYSKDSAHSFFKKPEQLGQIGSLEELRALVDKYPGLRQYPWLREKFIAMVPQLLQPGLTLETMAADTYLAAGKDEASRKQAESLVTFAASLGGKVSVEALSALGESARAQMDSRLAEAEKKRADETAALSEQLKAAKSAADSAQKKYQKKSGEDQAAHKSQQEALQKRIKELEAQLEKAKKDAAEQAKKARAEGAAAGAATAAVGAAAVDTSALQTELDSTKKELKQLMDVIKRRNDERLQQENKIRSLKQELQQAQRRRAEYEEGGATAKEAEQMRGEIKSAKAEAEKQKKAAQDAQRQLEETEKELSEAKKAKSAALNDLDVARRENSTLKESVTKLTKKSKRKFGARLFGFILGVIVVGAVTVYAHMGFPNWPLEAEPSWPLSINSQFFTGEEGFADKRAGQDVKPYFRLSGQGNWTQQEIAQLLQAVPGISDVFCGSRLSEVEDYVKPLEDIDGYTPTAVIFPSMALEDTDIFDHIVLLRKDADHKQDMEDNQEGKDLLRSGEKLGYQVMTLAGDYVLAVKGGGGTMRLSMNLLDRLERNVTAHPYLGISLQGRRTDINGFLREMTGDVMWWKHANDICIDVNQDGITPMGEVLDWGLDMEAAMRIVSRDWAVYMFVTGGDEAMTETLKAFAGEGNYREIADVVMIRIFN